VIVCHCFAVRDCEVRTEVRLGATSLPEVAARCGVTTDCGGCWNAVVDVIEDEQDRAEHGTVTS
jgi:bacterioferritin-associated ferredoxin